MAGRTKMAMSSDFLDAFARLPRPQQRSVRTLISRFNADSTAKGLNYEKIHAARDLAMRSLRIDQGYRAIVLKPEQGDVHMLLWADKHDAAYAWAGRHECRINPETGALQVYEPSTEPAAETRPPANAAMDAATADAAAPPAFGKLQDRELARLGVPPAMLSEVRGVCDDTDLDAMQPRLPLEAYEALFLFLAGESYEQLVRERESPDEPVDTGDFATALARHESRGRFVVVGAARARAWPVFEEYRTQLAERGLKEVDDAYRDAAVLLQNDPEALDYAAVIVDEGQDMGAQAYRLLRAVVPAGPNDLFVVGDGHQRIYGRNRVVLGRCGIDVRGRSRKLRLNYRTTEETRRWAARLLAGRAIDDLDGGADDDKGITSLTRGPEPLLRHFENRDDQSTFIVSYLKRIQAEDSSLRGVCVVARTRHERDAIAVTLGEHGLAHVPLEAGAVDSAEKDGVRLATMHRVKGLEFDRVVMASVNADLVPLPAAVDARGDAVERESAETEERALVYVAATRAKKELLVLSFGTPSRLL